MRKRDIQEEHRETQEGVHGERGEWWRQRSGETGAGRSGHSNASGSATQATGAGEGVPAEMGRLYHLRPTSICYKYGATHKEASRSWRGLVEGHTPKGSNVRMMMMMLRVTHNG